MPTEFEHDAISKADPKLRELLVEDSDENETIEVAVSLSGRDSSEILSPDQTTTLTNTLIDDVTAEVGEPPRHINVFQNIQSFVVDAKPRFIRALLEHDEVVGAIANRQ